MPLFENTHDIQRLLALLGEFDSVPVFTRLYYELVAARASRQTPEARELADLLVWHLEAEVRFHSLLKGLAGREEIPVTDMLSLADKRRISLQETLDRVDSLKLRNRRHAATAHLIAAECCYHLDSHDRVVAHLERAVQLGVDDPICYFALGYNRYLLAEEAFTTTDVETGRSVVVDESQYRTALLDAVTAFEDGISGGPLDPHLYWWMGTCLEKAGFATAAAHAFEQSNGLQDDDAPLQSEQTEAPDPGGSPGDRRDGATAHEESSGGNLPAISWEEVQQVGELLKRSFTAGEILGEDK
ncbi:MAG: hypothetical protein QM473_03560 [Acidobacteriota bacterium]|nr:hypothetical protein [Acidobacteriota bacterium]